MRILLADKEPRVRSAIHILLQRYRHYQIIDEVADGKAILLRASQARPDIIILDWSPGDAAGREMLAELRDCCPDTFVVAISSRPELRKSALAAGADAFVSKVDPPEFLLAAIERGMATEDPTTSTTSKPIEGGPCCQDEDQ